MDNKVSRLFQLANEQGVSVVYDSVKRLLISNLLSSFKESLDWGKTGEVEVTILGSRMILDLSDKGICRDLYYNRIREPQSTEIFIDELRKSRGNILEAGANIGYFALLEARTMQDGKIFAMEPSRRNFGLLDRNVSINSLQDRIELYNVAVGDQVGKARFVSSLSFNLSRVATPYEAADEVDMITVDEFLQGREICFLRLDVEGYEGAIVRGARETLKQKTGMKIFMEVHPSDISKYGGSIEEMWGTLCEAGFRVRFLVDYSKPRFKFARRGYLLGEVLELDMPLKQALKDTKLSRLLNNKYVYHLFLEQ